MESTTCNSCEIAGISTLATTTRNRDNVCEDCAAEIDHRAEEQTEIRETCYDKRGIRK